MKTTIIFLLLITQIFGHQEARFDNYQVYRVLPKTQKNLEVLAKLIDSEHFNFWTDIKSVNHYVDVMVPPYKSDDFENLLKINGIESTIFISDVQELVGNERARSRQDENFGWSDYYTLDEINAWLVSLVEEYPNIVTLEKAGTSYEGRDIIGVHVSFAPGNENKSVFFEGNIHACEWIGSSVVTYILNELLTSTDPEVRKVAESHDWYVFPVINPDGFEYSHTTNRTWRKTRVPHGTKCIGADPNRNWDYHYNEGGNDADPCSEMYGGPDAFSEPSTKTLAEYLLTIGGQLEGYIGFHSYSQMLLLPYGFTAAHLDNYEELYQVGVKALDALSRRYGTHYDIGDVAEIMYVASGGSPDWVKGTFGTRITYTFELRDTGKYGFLLPAEEIIPTAEETFDAIMTIFQEFAKRP